MVHINILDKSICQNLLDYSAILETTINDIDTFLSEINRVYSSIADKFPVIEESMANENTRVNSLVSYFSDEKEVENSFAYALEQNQKEFSNSFDRIKDFIDQDDILSESIIKDVDKTSSIMESIDNIRLLADQIKVYSLNAIIISSKHGEVGGAFGEISKNIIKLSDLANDQADAMNKVGNDLFFHFENFKTKILEANNNQKNDFIEVQSKILSEHSSMEKSFSIFSSIILDILKRVDGSYSYIFDIMMILQREDIIRQQTEHIVESICTLVKENKYFIETYYAKLEEYKKNKTDEKALELEHLLLDIVTFDDSVLSLVISNLKSVYDEISDSNRNIKMFLSDFREALLDVANDRDAIVDHMIGDEKDNSSSALVVSDILFEEYMGFINSYLSSHKIFLNKKFSISDDNADISDLIEFLETMFFETKNIAKTFNSINFLAKIELEKNREIFDNSKTFSIDSVEAIASNITKTVDESLVDFSAIKEEIFASVDKFKLNTDKEASEYNVIQDMTRSVNLRLEHSKMLVKNNLKHFKSYADELFHILDKTLLDLSSLDDILLSVEEVINVCDDMKSMVKSRKELYYESCGITSWKIESDKYLEIINSYTTQKERAIASDLIGDDVSIDVGSGSGELTIF